MNLSFVIIGDPNDGYCRQSILSIRKWFPGSEIILSTTIKPLDHLDWDRVVLNEDPGELINENHQGVKNLNRLIVNSYNGCRVASNNLVIRSRTDITFFSDSILKEYEKYQDFAYHFLVRPVNKNKILIGDMFTSTELTYHPGDWVLMAPKETLVEYYTIPLKSKDGISASPDHQLHRTEQYPFLSNIWKHYDKLGVYIKYDVDDSQKELSTRFLIDNFYIGNRQDLGFYSVKNNYPFNRFWTYERYKDIYEKITANHI